MAALQERNGSYRILFRFNGKQHAFTLGDVGKAEAESKAAQVDYLLMRVKQQFVKVPDAVDIVTFVRFDGSPPATSVGAPITSRHAVTLSQLKTRFLATLGNGTVEPNTLDACKIHLNHCCRFLGDGFPVLDLSLGKLQGYVNKRAKAGISPVTIKKEVSTLRAAWNWGQPMKLTSGIFPNQGLRYPKIDERPPFQTREEIERQLLAGGDPEALWGCLYLQTSEIAELLAHTKKTAMHPWVYPLFCFAAHTGARRSEIIRALVADVDFAGGTVVIRENKRSRGQRTTRRVPLTPLLREVLQNWLQGHPGGQYLFCHACLVARSKKRSRSTGHQSEQSRPSSLKERLATVRVRERLPQSPLTRNEVHHHFKQTLSGCKWAVVRGLHCLRHSFVSACASKGVDQRLIDEWVGHQTEQQRKRYRHLYPSTQQQAIKRVFGQPS